MLLSVNDIHVYYGAIHAVKGVSLEVNEGEIVTLIGANGAGKSTVLNTISGLLRAKTGTIEFMGAPINTVAYRSFTSSILLPANDKRTNKRLLLPYSETQNE